MLLISLNAKSVEVRKTRKTFAKICTYDAKAARVRVKVVKVGNGLSEIPAPAYDGAMLQVDGNVRDRSLLLPGIPAGRAF